MYTRTHTDQHQHLFTNTWSNEIDFVAVFVQSSTICTLCSFSPRPCVRMSSSDELHHFLWQVTFFRLYISSVSTCPLAEMVELIHERVWSLCILLHWNGCWVTVSDLVQDGVSMCLSHSCCQTMNCWLVGDLNKELV